MNALLGEPILLASYPTPSQNFPKSAARPPAIDKWYVGVTYSSDDRGEGFATVTVQGDGIHVLELSSMHAIVSHTLGPSAFFAAPAVTVFERTGASTSYAVTQAGSKSTEKGRMIWKWQGHISRRPEELPMPKSVVCPQRVAKLWAPLNLTSHIIAICPSGNVMISDNNLDVISSSAALDSHGVLLKSWVFPLEKCHFLAHQGNPPYGNVVMYFIMVGSRLKLRITLVQPSGTLGETIKCDLEVQKNVTDISCDSSGYTTILTYSGEWLLFRLVRDSTGGVSAVSLDEPLRLTGLSLAPITGDNLMLCGSSIMSVGSSFVLLAGLSSGPSPEIVLLLWDVQYSVVLAHRNFALPSTLLYTRKSPPMFELVPASRSQALLVLSPAVPTRATGPIANRSSVLVVPLTIPVVSTIALALGKARDTQKWLQNTHILASDMDEGRNLLMQSVRKAMEQGRPQVAEHAFFSWVERETARLRRLPYQSTSFNGNAGKQYSKGGVAPNIQPKDMQGTVNWKGPSRPFLSHYFVSNTLSMTLQPSKPPDAPYSSKIVRYLIDRQAVSNGMIEGGLVQALRRHQDWDSILSALHNVHDLPELDLIELLADVVNLHRQHLAPNGTGMHVDTHPNTPSLPSFLAKLVGCAMSPSMLRMALKSHLSDAGDIVFILEILEGWLAWWCNTSPGLVVDVRDIRSWTKHSSHPSKKTLQTESQIPSLDSMTLFLQCVLDAHYLTLLQYPPIHSRIERISRLLQEQLTCVEDLEDLRGPLEVFARAEVRKPWTRRAGWSGEGSRNSRKAAFEAPQLAVGLYQVEELVI